MSTELLVLDPETLAEVRAILDKFGVHYTTEEDE